MDRKPRILIVEDDPRIAATLVRRLREAGFETELVADGHAAVRATLTQPVDLVLLDLMLPGLDGFKVLEQLRGRVPVPVIVLSARTQLEDRVRSFDLGAVDYVPKPFWFEELLARIRLRLGAGGQAARQVAFGHAVLDLDARTVSVHGQAVELTGHEFRLLAYLVERPRKAISRKQLAEATLSPDRPVDARTVDSHLARIRRKLGEEAGWIRTVWGIGYCFEPPEDLR